jgi:YVTN family beta-propeller protein
LAFTPGFKYLYTGNGVSNEVSVIEEATLKVIKSIAEGWRLPLGHRNCQMTA